MVLDRTERFKVLLALEIGIYHMFAEGLAFFFMQYGAGEYWEGRISGCLS